MKNHLLGFINNRIAEFSTENPEKKKALKAGGIRVVDIGKKKQSTESIIQKLKKENKEMRKAIYKLKRHQLNEKIEEEQVKSEEKQSDFISYAMRRRS